jgi:hypothetical protein
MTVLTNSSSTKASLRYYRSYAQRVLSDIVVSFSYEPNLPNTWYREARQPSPSRRTLLEEVNAALYAGFTS